MKVVSEHELKRSAYLMACLEDNRVAFWADSPCDGAPGFYPVARYELVEYLGRPKRPRAAKKRGGK